MQTYIKTNHLFTFEKRNKYKLNIVLKSAAVLSYFKQNKPILTPQPGNPFKVKIFWIKFYEKVKVASELFILK